MDYISSTAGVLWMLLSLCAMIYDTTGHSMDVRCEKIAENPATACDAIQDDTESAVGISVDSKAICVEQEHCWYNGRCYKKPVTCYIDFRIEQCQLRQGWRVSRIFTGYSVNGSHCYVETIRGSIYHPETLWGSTSKHGVRILNPDELSKACVRYMDTTATRVNEGSSNCTVKVWFHGREQISNGTVRANKCVLKKEPHFVPYELGTHKTCGCRVDSWKESAQEKSIRSSAIQDYVKKEELKSSCAAILGRLVRDSWRERVDIVNSAEVDVVVDALLNTTTETSFIEVEDAKVLLDTSRQLSKYKFYEGLENDSADHLIQSTTKYLSNIMTKLMVKPTMPRAASVRSKRSLASQGSIDDDGNPNLEEHRVQWKIMENLEGIAENVASLIDIPMNATKYVMKAEEKAVSLQVTIAKPQNLNDLIVATRSDENNSTGLQQSAHVTDFSSYDEDENLAIITALYNIKEEKVNLTHDRASGILAINPRTIKDYMVDQHLHLPVTFTLSHFNSSCNGSCTKLCSFADPNVEDYGNSWKQTGCHVAVSNETQTTCKCNHTTHFAVLMLPYTERVDDNNNSVPVFSETDNLALEYISLILGSISVVALSITVIVFITYRRILLKDRMLIHFHMITALMGGYVSFLCGSIFSSGKLNVPDACFAFAIGSHLFFLATFFWFLMEAVYLFYKVVMVFSNAWAEWSTKFAPAFGWGVPVVTVMVAVGVSRAMDDVEGADPYYDAKTCFLQTKNNIIWFFLGPVFAIIVINTLVLIKVVAVIFKSSLSSAKKLKSTEQEKIVDSMKNSVKGAVLLMPILGTPWIINVFALIEGDAGIIMAYIHVVLMGLQGLSICLFYCVFNTEVRMAYKLSAERRRSIASLEPVSKSRKRSHAPLIALSKESSPEATRYKNSFTVASTGRTLTGISQLSSSPPSSPSGSVSPLPAVQEERC